MTAGLQGSRAAADPRSRHAAGALGAAVPGGGRARREDRSWASSVVVVGGGNVAMDVARTARRMGAEEVDVVCLESEDEMPASDEEVHEARQEGVKVHCSWGPVEVASARGERVRARREALRCRSSTSTSGSAPQFDEDERAALRRRHRDLRHRAVRRRARPRRRAHAARRRRRRRRVAARRACPASTPQATWSPVRARVVDAIAAGHRVAMCIVRDLTQRRLGRSASSSRRAEALGEVPQLDEVQARDAQARADGEARVLRGRRDLRRDRAGYTEYEAAREAQRCLGCTTGARLTREKCASCLTCMRVCPHDAPGVKVGGFLYFDAETCHACGACVSPVPGAGHQPRGPLGPGDDAARRAAPLRARRATPRWCSRAAARPTCPAMPGNDVRTLTVTCLLRVAETTALKALQSGASRIAFVGCVEANCRYPHARSARASSEPTRSRTTLHQLGMDKTLIIPRESREEEDVHLPMIVMRLKPIAEIREMVSRHQPRAARGLQHLRGRVARRRRDRGRDAGGDAAAGQLAVRAGDRVLGRDAAAPVRARVRREARHSTATTRSSRWAAVPASRSSPRTPSIPVYPALDTLFIGAAKGFGELAGRVLGVRHVRAGRDRAASARRRGARRAS